MNQQSQILRRLSRPEGLQWVREHLAENPGIHRTQLADRVCGEFGFVDPRGQVQRSGCLKALRVLARRGHFVLPVPKTRPGRPEPRRLESDVPFPENVPETVGAVRGLELVLVETEAQRRIWNTLLLTEHPQKAGPFVGRQLQYLIASEHGWLGCVGFASAALHLKVRDRWIGWDVDTRQAHLDRIVGMNRFLIRPVVNCKNLASRVLSMVMARMPQDFRGRYGYEPWLVETFVDSSRRGTCYQAANWIRVGSTRGRGRQDRKRERAAGIKELYVWVLADDFRARFEVPADRVPAPLPLDAVSESESWVEREFGGAPLGDKRLSQRLVRSAATMAENPTLSFPGAAGGDEALVKAHYRFIEKPDDSAVTMENILLPHREQTVRRMQAQDVVLCIQDGTDLDYNGASECAGLGNIGTNQTGAQSRGLHLHSTLAVTDRGIPLGVLHVQCAAPEPRPGSDTRKPHEIPIEEKKSNVWLVAMRDVEALAAHMPQTQIVQVMDRDADLFELFEEWSSGAKRTHLLVRAQHNRRTTGNSRLFDDVRSTEVALNFDLRLNRQSARHKRSKQKAKPGRADRVARVAVRYQQVEVPAPRRQHGGKDSIKMSIVHLVEEAVPDGVDPIEWYLLTTMEVSSKEQAKQLLDYYCLRWRIEDWHRVVKTGCRIEDLRNETAERIKRAVAIYLVIAWRIMLMTLLGREVPNLPAEVLFTDLEIKVLTAFAGSRRNLKAPMCLGDAVQLVGRLGGHLGRKKDPPPGHQVLWIGYSQLQILCTGFLLGRQHRE